MKCVSETNTEVFKGHYFDLLLDDVFPETKVEKMKYGLDEVLIRNQGSNLNLQGILSLVY